MQISPKIIISLVFSSAIILALFFIAASLMCGCSYIPATADFEIECHEKYESNPKAQNEKINEAEKSEESNG